MDILEEVAQFKREANSIKYLNKRKKELEEEITKINSALIGVKSPTLDAPRVAPSCDKLALIVKKDNLREELASVNYRIDKVYKSLELVENASDKQLVIDLWINKYDYRKLARQYAYAENVIFKKARKIMKKAFNKRNKIN